MKSSLFQFTSHGHELAVSLLSYGGISIPIELRQIIEDEFEQFAPFLKDRVHHLVARDIPEYSIDNKYPGGHCYNRHEVFIAVPDWETDLSFLRSTVAHELHHMARWQHAGYGDTLGGAILSEGIATFYDELQSGWVSPWAIAKSSRQELLDCSSEWNNADYDHDAWFYGHGKTRWVGYAIGYALAKQLYPQGFDLENSLNVTPDDVLPLLQKLHP